MEEAYADLLEWFNARKPPLPFKSVKVLNREGYGWAEHVDHLPCEDAAAARRFYQRGGMLLCTLYLLRGTDCHFENIIACGEHPLFIDLETLLYPQMRISEQASAWALAQDKIVESVLGSGLLPHWNVGGADRSFGVSGLGVEHKQETFLRAPKWTHINTDKMHVEPGLTSFRPGQNVPFLNGKNLSLADYEEDFVAGFREMYKFIVSHRQALLAGRGPLSAFKSQPVRFVLRPTMSYWAALKASLEPQTLRSGIDRAIALDILSRPLAASAEKPEIWPVVAMERASLEQMDIPRLVSQTDSVDLIIGTCRIPGYFRRPSFESVTERLNDLSHADMEEMVGYIRASFYSHSIQDGHSREHGVEPDAEAAPCIGSEDALSAAISIAVDLERRAVTSSDGSTTWIAPQFSIDGRRYHLEPIGYSLYEGSTGIALFFAALGKITGDSKFRGLALKSVMHLSQALRADRPDRVLPAMCAGGALGYGSLVYSLVRIADLAAEPALVDDAVKASKFITEELISGDKYLDIVYGISGAILGLLALYDRTQDQQTLERAISCGQQLISCAPAASDNEIWKSPAGAPILTGFSHGAAGIAYAVLRLYKVSREECFLSLAEDLVSYEDRFLCDNDWGEPAASSGDRAGEQRGVESSLVSWCHGAAGIGLSRAGGLTILDSLETWRDIDTALAVTEACGFAAVDQLCCGNFGRAELFLTASRELSRPELRGTALAIAGRSLKRARQSGRFQFDNRSEIFIPGLFRGSAGIGYQLLRLFHPDDVPCVLLWQ